MVVGMKRMVMELRYRDLMSIQDAAAAKIYCLSGRIWLTELGRGDVVLHGGDSYQVSQGGEVVVQALRDASVAVCKPVPQRRGRLSARIRAVGDRLSAAFCSTPPSASAFHSIFTFALLTASRHFAISL